MSLLGHLTGLCPLADDWEMAPETKAQISLQHEIETEAAFEHFSSTIAWLATEIAHQFQISFEAVHDHLSNMPDEHLRFLTNPFGWIWLAHDTAWALGLVGCPHLQITSH